MTWPVAVGITYVLPSHHAIGNIVNKGRSIEQKISASASIYTVYSTALYLLYTVIPRTIHAVLYISHGHSRGTPGVFYTCFYNHAHRLRSSPCKGMTHRIWAQYLLALNSLYLGSNA
jgi:hypothetical protein